MADVYNERGNILTHSFLVGRERGFYDGTLGDGWKQWDTDQDAWYFGIWVHAKERKILTFAEGDETLVVCPTQETFEAEIESLKDFFGETYRIAIVIDEDGATEYRGEH